MTYKIPECFDIDWEKLPEENQVAYLTRCFEFECGVILKLLKQAPYTNTLSKPTIINSWKQALQNLS